jgi:hypothetical protein
MLINKSHQNSIKRVAAYPSTDIESDITLIATLKFKGVAKRVANKKNKSEIYDIPSLSDIGKREMLEDELHKYFRPTTRIS